MALWVKHERFHAKRALMAWFIPLKYFGEPIYTKMHNIDFFLKTSQNWYNLSKKVFKCGINHYCSKGVVTQWQDSTSPWKEQLARPSVRMRQNYNFQGKFPKDLMHRTGRGHLIFPAWSVDDIWCSISMENFSSASFWQRIVPTAPFNKWQKHSRKCQIFTGKLWCNASDSYFKSPILEKSPFVIGQALL